MPPTPAKTLPLAFHVPAGWPTPTLEWTAAHLGWQPPPGWVPVIGCPHSPPRFAFWSRNRRAWARLARPRLRSARRNLAAGVVLVLLLTVWTVHNLLTDVAPLWLIAQGAALLVVAIKTLQARDSIRRLNAELFEHIRATAETLKIESDRAHYERYLRSTSDA